MRKFVLSILGLIFAALGAKADSVLIGATNPGNIGAALSTSQAIAQPFTLTQGISVSSVNVLVGPFAGGSGEVTVQLTNRLGMGTTLGNVLAEQTFSISSLPDTGNVFSISAALTLMPGTYYLVLSSPEQTKNNGVFYASTILPSSVGNVGFASFTASPGSFAPGATFSAIPANVPITFDIVGHAVGPVPCPQGSLLSGVNLFGYFTVSGSGPGISESGSATSELGSFGPLFVGGIYGTASVNDSYTLPGFEQVLIQGRGSFSVDSNGPKSPAQMTVNGFTCSYVLTFGFGPPEQVTVIDLTGQNPPSISSDFQAFGPFLSPARPSNQAGIFVTGPIPHPDADGGLTMQGDVAFAAAALDYPFPSPTTHGPNANWTIHWCVRINVPCTSTPPHGSVQITSVKISQGQPLDDGTVGNGAEVVLNRPAVVQIKGTPSGTVPNTVTVDLSVANQTVKQSVNVSDLISSDGAFVFFTPSTTSISPGEYMLSVSFEPISGVTTGNAKTLALIAYPPSPIKFEFVNVTMPGYVVANFSKMAGFSNNYVQGVFPLDSSYQETTSSLDFTLSPLSVIGLPETARGGVGSLVLLADLAVIALVDGLDRAVGVTSPAYLEDVDGSGVRGISAHPLRLPSAIVSEGFPEQAAHELGHTYGLYNGKELYEIDPTCQTNLDAVALLPYWVQLKTLLEPIQNYMCDPDPRGDSFYQSGALSPDRWGTLHDWSTILSSFTGLPDPETLIVAGYVDHFGNVVLGASYRNTSGKVLPSSGGTYAVSVLDSHKNVLSSTAFTPSFTATDTQVVSSYAPFVFNIPYPSTAWSVQVTNGSKILATENVSYGLLLRAVQTLQDASFVANPTQHRTALLNMVYAFNQQLATGNTTGAYQFLTKGIERQISLLLSDSYVAPNPLVYTKASLLKLVNEIAQRLAAKNKTDAA